MNFYLLYTYIQSFDVGWCDSPVPFSPIGISSGVSLAHLIVHQVSRKDPHIARWISHVHSSGDLIAGAELVAGHADISSIIRHAHWATQGTGL